MKKRILSILLAAIMLLSLIPMTVLADTTPEYQYTEYVNWQIKYGTTWEWSDDMEKVEDGLFKLADANWQGTGINVKSDANPIKKDWFEPGELTIGEGLIAPVIVDVYLKVIDDETVRIGVGVIPEDSAPKPGDKKIITEISLSLTEYTRDNISFTSIPYPEAKITGITEGNEDIKLETGYIYFFDKDGKWIYCCWISGPEAKPVWYDMSSYKVGKDGMIEGEKVIDTAPDYSKIKKAIASVLATSENGFAPELKVTVNGKALGVSKMDKGTYNADDMAGYQVMEQYSYFFVPFDIADSTTSPKTGDTSNMALWLILMALSSTGLCACLILGKKRKNEQ